MELNDTHNDNRKRDNRLDVSLTSSLFRGFVFVGAISENLNSHK